MTHLSILSKLSKTKRQFSMALTGLYQIQCIIQEQDEELGELIPMYMKVILDILVFSLTDVEKQMEELIGETEPEQIDVSSREKAS